MKEKLTKITTSKGEEFDVYVLKVFDIIDIDFQQKDFMHRLAAKSLGISFEEFCEWDFHDGFKVIDLLGKSMNVLGDLK